MKSLYDEWIQESQSEQLREISPQGVAARWAGHPKEVPWCAQYRRDHPDASRAEVEAVYFTAVHTAAAQRAEAKRERHRQRQRKNAR
jgi:hypothetical protein